MAADPVFAAEMAALAQNRGPWTYTWLGGVVGEPIQPIERVEGKFADAWAERMTRPLSPVHESRLYTAAMRRADQPDQQPLDDLPF